MSYGARYADARRPIADSGDHHLSTLKAIRGTSTRQVTRGIGREVSDNRVTSIDLHALDHTVGAYRLYHVLEPDGTSAQLDVPIRIKLDWNRLTELTR
jgi:hypothetical protein